MDEPEIYRIRIEGYLGDEWSGWLGNMAIEQNRDGTVTLTGPVIDQSALLGLLLRIHDMGLKLVSCQRISDSKRD
jgi:hypothetical protein